MINGMTVEEYNAKERRRSSCVAKLHGYTPFEDGDTEESLKAEYEAITGEAYKTQEQETAERAAVQRQNSDAEYQAQMDADLRTIADAKNNGFMDCKMVRDGLGFDQPKANGSYYSSMQTAYRWIEDAGEEVVFLLPDGGMYYIGGVRKTISRTLRTGVYADVFVRVLAVKEAYYAKLKHDEWVVNMRDAESVRSLYGAQTKNMDWDAYIEGLGPEPPAPNGAVTADAETRRADRDASKATVRKAEVRKALASYRDGGLPLNRKGYPKRNPLNAHAGFSLTREERIQGWDELQKAGA